MYVCVPYTCLGPREVRRKASDPWELELKLNNLISLLQLIWWEKPQNHECLKGRKIMYRLRLDSLNSTCSWAVGNAVKIHDAERNLSQKESRSRCAQRPLWLLAGLLPCRGAILGMLLHFIDEDWGKEKTLNGTDSGSEAALHWDLLSWLVPEAHLSRCSWSHSRLLFSST